MKAFLRSPLSLVAALLLTGLLAKPAMATDLLPLVTEGNVFKTQLSGIVLTRDNLCAQMISADQAAKSYINNITAVSNGLTAPLTVDTGLLDSLDQLSLLTLDSTAQLSRLSTDLSLLSLTAPMCNISDGLTGMLQLSDDIGTMADRILEMADKILTMADNIGLMADRIIITQQLQNQNIALTQASILTTQANMLSLVSVADTTTYNLDLQTLLSDGNLLAARLATVVLNPFNLRTQMQHAADDVAAFAARVATLNSAITADSTTSTFYINRDSLLALGNMNIMLNSLGTVARAYSVTINGIAAITSKDNLLNAARNLLSMSADIGVMADNILEMSDLILAMSDNIGLEADQILATQELQNVNIAATQASILSAQTVAIRLFVAAPTVSGFWPNAVVESSVVFVFGSNFVPGQTQVTVGGVPATIVQVLDSSLLFFMPPSPSASGFIAVTTPAGKATGTTQFGVPLTSLAVTGIWPAQGPVGTIVFLFGHNFVPRQTQVSLNGVNAPIRQVLDSGLLFFMVPPEATTGTIKVTTPASSVTTSGRFIVTP